MLTPDRPSGSAPCFTGEPSFVFTTFAGVIGLFSKTGAITVVSAKVLGSTSDVGVLLSGSLASGIPSLSSSVSVTSGLPSPSVSRSIVTGTFTVEECPSLSVTVTGMVISFVSSSPFQVSTFGVPVKLPSLSTVNPLTSDEVILLPLSVSTALVLAGTFCPSVAFKPSFTVTGTSKTVGFLSSLSLIPSPSVSAFLGSVPFASSS